MNDFTWPVNSAVNGNNVKFVVGMAVNTVDNVREVGAFGLDLLIAVRDNPALNNTAGLIINPAPTTLAIGQYTITLTNYVTSYSGDQATLLRVVHLEHRQSDRDPEQRQRLSVGLTVTNMDVTHVDNTNNPIKFEGGLKFTRQTSSGNVSEKTQNNGSSGTVTITSGGTVETIKTFTIQRTQTSAGLSILARLAIPCSSTCGYYRDPGTERDRSHRG